MQGRPVGGGMTVCTDSACSTVGICLERMTGYTRIVTRCTTKIKVYLRRPYIRTRYRIAWIAANCCIMTRNTIRAGAAYTRMIVRMLIIKPGIMTDITIAATINAAGGTVILTRGGRTRLHLYIISDKIYLMAGGTRIMHLVT